MDLGVPVLQLSDLTSMGIPVGSQYQHSSRAGRAISTRISRRPPGVLTKPARYKRG